jgi:uncharacterized protein with HEPN domain
MLPDQDRVRIQHMLDAARDARFCATGRVRADLDTDVMLRHALVRCLEVVGEAASKVSAETQRQFPETPWADVIGMRHRLSHGYFDVNLDIVWTTVEDDLPRLIGLFEKALVQ